MTTRLLIRRVALAPEQVSADPRSRRRRTLNPEQRALPIAELAGADAIYAYSFVVTLCRPPDYADCGVNVLVSRGRSVG